MRILYILIACGAMSVLLLWLGLTGVLQRTRAALLALGSLLVAGGLLLLAVLPGNSFYGPVLTHVATPEKVVALTFDDGPYGRYTDELLQLLEAKQVHATFFIVGENALEHPEQVRREKELGHDVALHAGIHKDFLKQDAAELRANLAYGKQALQQVAGVIPRFVRPPHGFKDWQVVSVIESEGLQAVNWSVIPRDWTNPGADVIAERVCTKVEPGSIVLLHDGDSPKKRASREQTIQAVGVIIDRLRAQGYRFVTVSELLELQEKVKK